MEKRTLAVFFCLYFGYTVITYVRKSVSFASPSLMETENMDKSLIGLILSSQGIGYSVGKLLGGVLVDLYSPSTLFTASLFMAGISVVAFTVCDSMSMFVVCWFINGLSQGPSWPACAVLIKQWFPPEKFGTWWSILSTSMNISGTFGPLVSAFLLSLFDWKTALNAAATCAIALTGLAYMILDDRPTINTSDQKCVAENKALGSSKSWKEGIRALLRQPLFLSLCVNYMLVSTVRGACTDWGHHYLIDESGHSNLTGSSFISSQELGGIFGSLAAGCISDYFMSKNASPYNPRTMVILLCTILHSAFMFFFLIFVTSYSSYLSISILGFGIGFGIYGSITLLGVAAMELTSDNQAGTAHSIASLFANLGMVLSGYPLSLVARQNNWYTAFLLVEAVSFMNCRCCCV
ncbi:glucose-6-phosphate exchanger SLC37A4-like isoform X2 [Pomacea canaliculata]|nr:glucose-6-phosphate exchanger SLC37A4-like isoform X2 [Pomacea canaliculata]